MESTSLRGFSAIPPAQHPQIQASIQRINFPALQNKANLYQASITSSSPPLSCTINPLHFGLGRSNLVFEILFPDSTTYIARIATNHFNKIRDHGSPNETTWFQIEVETMQYISDKTRIPIPKVLDYDSDPMNPVGFRYIIMEKLEGRPLGMSYFKIPTKFQMGFLEQFAEFMVQLGGLSFERIGCLRYNKETGDVKIVPMPEGREIHSSSRELVLDIRRSQDKRVLEDQTFPTTLEDRRLACKILRYAALNGLRSESMDGPFPLRHPDLHSNNILVDNEYNITGIIDWSCVMTAPQESFASFYGFRCPPEITGDKVEKYENTLELLRCALRKREGRLVNALEAQKGKLGEGVGVGKWLKISEYVESDAAEGLSRALEGGKPWRAVPYAKYLALLLFKDCTWKLLLEMDR